jgi:hypothetical protein
MKVNVRPLEHGYICCAGLPILEDILPTLSADPSNINIDAFQGSHLNQLIFSAYTPSGQKIIMMHYYFIA